MAGQPYTLYWKDQLVGTITDVRWTDFPWASGRFTMGSPSKKVRAVLEYVAARVATDDGLCDWPFSDALFDLWRIVQPNGTSVEISPPIIDFANGSIEWR